VTVVTAQVIRGSEKVILADTKQGFIAQVMQLMLSLLTLLYFVEIEPMKMLLDAN